MQPADNNITTNKRIAVMDLGTNTFHLLVAEVNNGSLTELARDYEAVKLGEGGISKGFIQPIPYQRGIATMQKFGLEIQRHNAGSIKAIATSMLRNASNGHSFIADVKAKTGIQIELIDGQQEAAYIYQGVKASGCLSADASLILDIGGGSVEFILCTHENILWKQSFEIGAVRLMDRFHQTDPIPHDAIEALNLYLSDVLKPLFNATQHIHIGKLIGSAGAFETFAEVIELNKGNSFDIKHTKCYDFALRDFIDATNTIIRSHHAERMQMKGIIPLRVDMIVVASLLTRFVMERLNIDTVGMSTYSLKEGVMAGLAEG
jgi:exopolyphosphatase / guanosine-5'-triphosphate,3'-diphosphate pyrophosphatase